MSGTTFTIVLLLVFSWKMIAVSGFVVTEEELTYSKISCPAIPTFDTVAYISGMNIELPCKCITDGKVQVIWYYKKTASSTNTQLLTSFGKEESKKSYHVESKITTKVRSMIIHKAREEDSGLYICGSRDGEFFWGYDVDIQDASSSYVIFQVFKQSPQPNLVTEHLTAFTAFWDWGKCDRCDVQGEQQRIGLCYVKSDLLDPRFRISENGVASCGSEAVPPALQEEVLGRRPEIYYRTCETICHKRKKGFIGTIKYWMHELMKLKDYIPWLPRAPTETHTHTLGSTLTLSCPGAKPEDSVAWDKGTKGLYKSNYLIGQKKANRVYIDYGNNLNFKSVTFSDRATYYCWCQGELKAGIKLKVEIDPTEKRQFGDADSILALKIIGSSFGIFALIFVLIHCFKCYTYNLRCSPCIDEEVV